MAEDYRRVGVAEGNDEYTEHLVREVYPDGSIVDGDPQRGSPADAIKVVVPGLTLRTKRAEQDRIRTVRMIRTVRTQATPWAEYVPGARPPEPAPASSQPEVPAITALDSVMHSIWLHASWRDVTKNMTSEEREAAADAVARRCAAMGESEPFDLRWWR